MIPLKESGYCNTSVEDFSHIEDLFAMILAKGISNLKRTGLLCDYESKSEDLNLIRGKINISQSIATGIYSKKKVICEYDEWTENSYFNKVIKAFLFHLLSSTYVNKDRKEKLKKLIPFFSNVNLLSIHEIQWNKVKYNTNNATYKMLIDICKFLYDASVYTTEKGIYKRQNHDYEKTLHSIYEKFLLEYFKHHYPQYTVHSPYIKWSLDDGYINDFLPAMKSDIVILDKETNDTLIIDAKFYTRSMNNGKYGESTKLHSHNLYQIYTYVKNEQFHSSGKVSGILLYAKTDEKITPNAAYSFDNNKITAISLDLNQDFEDIKLFLNSIVDKWSLKIDLCD